MAPSTFELATFRMHFRTTATSAMSVERHKQQKHTAVEMNNIFIYDKNVTGNNKLLVTKWEKTRSCCTDRSNVRPSRYSTCRN
jgi:hypothetical protein